VGFCRSCPNQFAGRSYCPAQLKGCGGESAVSTLSFG
jgi:hypothetical protein